MNHTVFIESQRPKLRECMHACVNEGVEKRTIGLVSLAHSYKQST